MSLNLAREPFRNDRPRRRLTGILWSLAGLALAINLVLATQYWLGSSNGRERLRGIRGETDQAITDLRTLRGTLTASGLAAQNEQVRFLNRKIAERTFPWSRLFDDVAEVLPRNVRFSKLAPSIPIENTRSRRRGQVLPTSIDWIDLTVVGTAKTSDDLFDLVDAMFEHEAFAAPVLRNEKDTEVGVDFGLGVRYRVAEPGLEFLEDQIELTGIDSSDAGAPEATAAAPASARVADSSSGPASLAATGSDARRAGDSARAPDSATSTRAADALPSSASLAEAASSAAGRPVTEPRAQTGARGPRRADADQRPRDRAATAVRAIQPNREPTAEEIADERFGAGRDVSPRLPNASGTGSSY